MENDYYRTLDPARQQAVTELTGVIRKRYPTASSRTSIPSAFAAAVASR